jgi:hypothetical protein
MHPLDKLVTAAVIDWRLGVVIGALSLLGLYYGFRFSLERQVWDGLSDVLRDYPRGRILILLAAAGVVLFLLLRVLV